MNKYVKDFVFRGLMFAGFGPIILGIIYYTLSQTIEGFSLGGSEVLLGIISIYILAFVQAGATVFPQIEHWSVGKSLLCHFGSLYLVYVGSYLVNSWIPFEPMILLVFTAIFTAIFFSVWLAVFFSVKAVSKKLNAKLN